MEQSNGKLGNLVLHLILGHKLIKLHSKLHRNGELKQIHKPSGRMEPTMVL